MVYCALFCRRNDLERSPMSDDLVMLDDRNFDEEIRRGEGGPILVDFWAAWCGPCRMVAPILETIAAEMKGTARIGKLDVDHSPATAQRYGIQSIPTMILFKNGRQVDMIIGAQSREVIASMIRRHIA